MDVRRTSSESLPNQMRIAEGRYQDAIVSLAREMVSSAPVHPRPTGPISLWRAAAGRPLMSR